MRTDPPPVDEAALAARLVEMAKPSAGERAIILFDPTYYPGITARLRESLHARGVQTYAIVEDTPAMVATYINDETIPNRREADVVETLEPVFQRSEIFYWMPTRGYGDDLRWERLVGRSHVRSIHFHWLLPFPGTRTADEIVSQSHSIEERALTVDLAAHARSQVRLANALRGRTVHVTTPAGTDLTLAVRVDEWFHFGNGDASKTRADRGRWIRDRQIELPVGMFQFVSDRDSVAGTIVTPTISQAGSAVRDARLRVARGRIVDVAAAEGADWIRAQMPRNGPDGDRIALVSLDTNPLSPPTGIGFDIGSNWENGGSNNANRMWRMSITLRDPTMIFDGRTIMRDGQLLWDAF